MPSLQLESTKNCNRFGSFRCWSYTPLQCSYLRPHLPQTIVDEQEKSPKSPKSTSLGLLSIRSRSIPSPLWFNWLIFVSLPPGTQPLSCHEFPSTFINPWQNPAILPKPFFGFPAPPKLPGIDSWDEWHRSQFFRWSHINGDLWQWDSSSECGEDPGAWDTKGSRGNATLLVARCDGSMFGQSASISGFLLKLFVNGVSLEEFTRETWGGKPALLVKPCFWPLCLGKGYLWEGWLKNSLTLEQRWK